MSDKRLSEYSMDELAAWQRCAKPSGGIQFARNDASSIFKDQARQMVVDLLKDRVLLRLLSMPGVLWKLEYQLLLLREGKYSTFTAVENDRAIFFAAAAKIPGKHTGGKLIRKRNFMEMGFKTKYAAIFFANIDDFMNQDEWNSDNPWSDAWLDYTGPLTLERLEIIKKFYDRHIGKALIITALDARWNPETGAAIKKHGGQLEWISKNFEGNIKHAFRYYDTSPMLQFAIEK